MAATLARHPWLVAIDEMHDVVGYAYAGPHRERAGYRWSVDISVYVDPGRHRRGIGRRLYAALLPLLRRLRLVNACAGIALPNAGSEALHRAIGMEELGLYRRVGWKAGRWIGVAWYGMGLMERGEPPDEPLPFSDLGSA